MIGMVDREREKEGQDSCRERVQLAQNDLGIRKFPSAAQLPLRYRSRSEVFTSPVIHIRGPCRRSQRKGKAPQEDGGETSEKQYHTRTEGRHAQTGKKIAHDRHGWLGSRATRTPERRRKSRSESRRTGTNLRTAEDKAQKISGVRAVRAMSVPGRSQVKERTERRSREGRENSVRKPRDESGKSDVERREGGRRAGSTFELENAGW